MLVALVAALLGGVLVVGYAWAPTLTPSGKPTARGTADPPTPDASASASGGVKVVGTKGHWRLTVDGANFQVKGITYGLPDAQADMHLPKMREMGVNTIRTWTTGASTEHLLKVADANDLKVISGIWLSHKVDYVHDTAYKTKTLNVIKHWVKALRDSPSLLMWDVGNEVLGTLPYSGAELVRQRKAYVSFIEQVTKAIHAIDPHHPVTASESGTGSWSYYEANAPSIDLYAVNTYSRVCHIRENWTSGNYTKPYIVTETGPPGYWEVRKDPNGVPIQPSDGKSSAAYAKAWKCINSHPGVSLGGALFQYGATNDFDSVWWALRTGSLHRLSYYTVARLYGGAPGRNRPPVISAMSVASSPAAKVGGKFVVYVKARDPDHDAVKIRVRMSSHYIDGSDAISDATYTRLRDGGYRIAAPKRPGVWAVYVYVEDGNGNVGIEARSVRVLPRKAAS